jgi:hypothetical protein
VAGAHPTAHVDAIITLTQEIAQLAPECGGKALKIISAARELGDRPDRAMIEDAIEGKLIDSEILNHSFRVSHRPWWGRSVETGSIPSTTSS